MERSQNSLVVLLDNVLWDALHAKDFNIESCTIREGIIDGGEILLVDLTHVDAEA